MKICIVVCNKKLANLNEDGSMVSSLIPTINLWIFKLPSFSHLQEFLDLDIFQERIDGFSLEGAHHVLLQNQ